MRKLKLDTAMAIVFLVFFLGFLMVSSEQKPRILVLQSYAPDFSWTADIDTAIKRVLEKSPYSLRWQYMDTKSHPDSEFKRKAGLEARRVISSWQPDVVIAVDDNVQELAAAYFRDDPNIDIVFTGVNAKPEKYGYEKAKNVTGVIERIPYAAFKESFLAIAENRYKRIYHISDASETSRYIHEELMQFPWEPLVMVKSVQCETFADWQAAVGEAAQLADILLVTHYHTVKRPAEDSTTMKPAEVLQWTLEHSSIPAIGSWGFFVEDGGALAIAVSPYEQGELAAKAALEIIEGRARPSEIPVMENKLHMIYARESGLQDYGIKLPALYEAFARATGHYYQ